MVMRPSQKWVTAPAELGVPSNAKHWRGNGRGEIDRPCSSVNVELMKSPPEPGSNRALARMRRFPTRSMTDNIKRESEFDEPVKFMAETKVVSTGGVGSSSVI